MKPATELLERCKRDDRRAHYELYRICFPFLVSVCRRYYVNREDTEAAINQIFLKTIINLDRYLKRAENLPFELWLRKIAVNLVVDEFRKNKQYREHFDLREIHEAEADHPTVEPHLEAEQLEAIQSALQQLSDMNRTVFNLHVVDGYKHEEIAAMLNITTGTSKAHLYRAKKRLRELIDPEQVGWQQPNVNKALLP